MNVDLFEAVIAFVRSDADLKTLVGERIAAKHRYGSAWEQGAAAVTLKLDGGTPSIYTPVQDLRIEARCYAPTPQAAFRIWRRLIEIGQDRRGVGHRVRVNVSEGHALLHTWLQASGPSTLYDDALRMDFVLGFFLAQVGEDGVS